MRRRYSKTRWRTPAAPRPLQEACGLLGHALLLVVRRATERADKAEEQAVSAAKSHRSTYYRQSRNSAPR